MTRRWRHQLAVGVSACLVGTLPSGVGTPAAAQVSPTGNHAQVEVEAVSVHWRTGRPVGWTGSQEMSDDGRRVLFQTEQVAVTDHPVEFGLMLYVRDLARDVTSVVSARSDGTPVYGSSWRGMGISGDGRLAAFAWKARRLSPTGKHPTRYAYIKHLRTGRLDAIRGRGSGVTKGLRPLSLSVKEISRHGRYLAGNGAFHAGGVWADVNVYLLDRRTGRWHWICPSGGTCHVEGMSDNGRYVAYGYRVHGGHQDYYVHDRVTGESTLVPRGPAGESAYPWRFTFSGDSRLMALTWADDEAGTNYNLIYRAADLEMVERLPDPLSVGAINHNGRYLAVFAKPGDLPAQTYRFDRRTGEYTLLSVNAAGEPANYWSLGTDISADGSTVVFNSGASNLVPGDRRLGGLSDIANWDAFVATIGPPEPPCPPWSCPPPPPR